MSAVHIPIRPFTLGDYERAMALWQEAEGITLREADSRPAIARYLRRNRGLSFVSVDRSTLVGAVLCGHDGRRGYLHHLAVAPSHRGQGIGRALAQRCLAALAREGIRKCHLFVLTGNARARRFWQRVGWTERDDVVLMSVAIAAGSAEP